MSFHINRQRWALPEQVLEAKLPVRDAICLLFGYLIFRSTFLPRILGALMAIGGLGWLTYMSPPLVNSLSPYNLALGILGQESVMLWLLVMGVNTQRWKEQASGAVRAANDSK